MPKITGIKTFITSPFGVNLVVVRVDTDQPGLYGLGCATFTQRCKAVVSVIEDYLVPLLKGREAAEIQEIWNLVNQNAYWRNGPVVNMALGGIDLALWDIKGKMAGMPVYDLLGGKCREAIAVYLYANGDSKTEILEKAQKLWEEDCHYIRLQYNPMQEYPEMSSTWRPDKAKPGFYIDPKQYVRHMVDVIHTARDKMGFGPEFIHDVHERIPPNDAIYMAQALEDVRMYFLEDLFAPEQNEYYRQVKNICTTPVAQGELFTNPAEWMPLVTERLIDFMRVHITFIGGVTPALRCAHLCELFGVRIAWHGPFDLNPIGHVAQMHLNLISPNFGIQEWSGYNEAMYEVFDGIPDLRKGYAYVNDKPGFGVKFNEKAAAKYPHKEEITGWTQFRHPDGGLFLP